MRRHAPATLLLTARFLVPALFLSALLAPARAAAPAPPVATATPKPVAPAATPPAAVAASPAPLPAPTPATATICEALGAAAARNGLPTGYFTRLIWQESRFDPAARSPAGAQGVAQFMPATASFRGLADPFAAAPALDEAAAYLKDLRAQFGNLGLAAAAYNAGPGRLARWIAGAAALPQETIDYVAIVTGHSVWDWRGSSPPALAPEPDFSCLAFAGEAGRHRVPASPPATTPDGKPAPPPKPWSVILVGSLNRGALMNEYNIVRATYSKILGALTPSGRRRRIGGEPTLRYVVQIEEDDRPASDRLCHRLEQAGGACIVLRNSGR